MKTDLCNHIYLNENGIQINKFKRPFETNPTSLEAG